MSKLSFAIVFVVVSVFYNAAARADAMRKFMAFSRLAISPGMAGQADPAVLKWTAPIVIGLYSVPEALGRPLHGVIAEAQPIIRIPVKISREKVNFPIIGLEMLGVESAEKYGRALSAIFYKQESARSFFGDAWKDGEACRGHLATSAVGDPRVIGAVLLVNLKAPVQDVSNCLVDGFVMALGLHPSAGGGLETAFGIKSLAPPYLLADDRLALALLYSDNMPSGVNREMALKIARNR